MIKVSFDVQRQQYIAECQAKRNKKTDNLPLSGRTKLCALNNIVFVMRELKYLEPLTKSTTNIQKNLFPVFI